MEDESLRATSGPQTSDMGGSREKFYKRSQYIVMLQTWGSFFPDGRYVGLRHNVESL